MTEHLPSLLTSDEVAEVLRIPIDHVWRLIRTKRLPAFKVGRDYRIKREDLELFTNTKNSNDSEEELSND